MVLTDNLRIQINRQQVMMSFSLHNRIRDKYDIRTHIGKKADNKIWKTLYDNYYKCWNYQFQQSTIN